MENTEYFVTGFIKEANVLKGFLRRSIKPAALALGLGGAAAGGYTYGKGKGADTQIGKDEKWFRGYLKADRQRDMANIQRAVRVGARYGYQQGTRTTKKKVK